MAKRRYRRFYKRKGKWSTRLTNINVTQQVNGGIQFFVFRTLATNPVQDDNTVSQRFTVKNVQCQIEIQQTGGEQAGINFCQQYILFIPQGYQLTADTPYEHPEWIMAHRYLGSPVENDTPYFPAQRFTTRLARKLDTGDRVVYLFSGTNTSQSQSTINVNGVVKLNTKAN